MPNLGSTDTPAAAQSLDLPNGYSPAIEEDSGDLVINDSNGNTALRWDDTNGQFQLAAPLDAGGNDVTNVGALGTEEVQIGSGDAVTGGPYGDAGDWILVAGFKISSTNMETASTEWTRTEGSGQSAYVPKSILTDAANVAEVGLSYGGYIKGDTAGETAYTAIGYEFERLTKTEVSAPHNGKFATSPIQLITDRGDSRTVFYMKTTGGKAVIESNLVQYLWIKIQ